MQSPFDAIGISTHEIARFQEAYTALKEKFALQATGHIDFHLEEFGVFKQYLDISIRNSYVIKHHLSDCYILFIDTHYNSEGGKGIITEHHEYQTWALAYLKHDFGRVMIRPETLTDKLIELIHPIELDFAEDKAFSDTFYVLVNDHQKAVTGINRNFRNAVMDIREDNFVIEIVNHTLVIGNRKPISQEKAIYLAEFVVRLCSNC